MENNKYQSGKIYRIVDSGYNKCYYGSTTVTISKRMAGHRGTFKTFMATNAGSNFTVFKIFTDYGVENCKIELVELYPCSSKAELEAREGYYIRNNECVNKIIAGRSPLEYYHDHKERIDASSRQYKIDNKEALKQKGKEYYLKHKEALLASRKEYMNEYYQKNKDKSKEYYLRNRETILAKKKVEK